MQAAKGPFLSPTFGSERHTTLWCRCWWSVSRCMGYAALSTNCLWGRRACDDAVTRCRTKYRRCTAMTSTSPWRIGWSPFSPMGWGDCECEEEAWTSISLSIRILLRNETSKGWMDRLVWANASLKSLQRRSNKPCLWDFNLEGFTWCSARVPNSHRGTSHYPLCCFSSSSACQDHEIDVSWQFDGTYEETNESTTYCWFCLLQRKNLAGRVTIGAWD